MPRIEVTEAASSLPFGKYKGIPLREVPDGYLVWLRTQHEANKFVLRDTLKVVLEAEWRRRYPPITALTIDPEVIKEAEEILTAGYRALAKRYHPDLGGSEYKMRKLNEAVDALRKGLKEVM